MLLGKVHILFILIDFASPDLNDLVIVGDNLMTIVSPHVV